MIPNESTVFEYSGFRRKAMRADEVKDLSVVFAVN